MTHILVVEDDSDIAKLIAMHLEDEGYQVTVVHDGALAIAEFRQRDYALVVLDVMLPNVDGLELCKALRAENSYPLIVMLTAKSSERDRVLGLDLGADDYVSKPFSVLELKARINALLRRQSQLSQQLSNAQLELTGLNIDPLRRRVLRNDEVIDLTNKEFDLLLQFAQNPGKTYTRNELLDLVWGYGYEGYEHTVNSHINRLRAKIEEDPSAPIYIQTVWGVGYMFVAPNKQASG